MSKPKWIFKVGTDGKVEVEGVGFSGSQCLNDVIYQILEQNATFLSPPKMKNENYEEPVENLYYIERG